MARITVGELEEFLSVINTDIEVVFLDVDGPEHTEMRLFECWPDFETGRYTITLTRGDVESDNARSQDR